MPPLPGLTAALRAVIPVQPQQPPAAVDLGERFEHGPVVHLDRSPFAGLDPAHLPSQAA